MGYVVLRPHSNTNETDSFRVVDYDAWIAYRNGDTSAYPSQERETAGQAEALCDQLNSGHDSPQP
jgi:hypothetical protein